MLSAQINTTQILGSYRKTDAVLIVCQNNTTRAIEIAAINEEAARVIGYSNEELVSRSFTQILPERLASTVAEFVEYGDDQNDLLAVLNKIRNFAIKTRAGEELKFRLRIIRGEAVAKNPWFHLVLIDEEKLARSNAFREVLKENFKGHEIIDERTNLPNRVSLLKDLELIVYHVRNREIAASFAVLDINHYDRLRSVYSEQTCDRLHEHIGKICKQKLRAEDTVGTLSERGLGLILVDAPQEAAHMVLNRLRWAISINAMPVMGKEELLAQVNISFSQIDGKIGEADVLEKCETFSRELRAKTFNSVHLVVTHERREKVERRVKNVPVVVERRRKERRKKKN